MNPAAKFLLFLLALPFLIGIFIVVFPLLIFFLLLSLFIPSIRFFHFSGSAPNINSHPADEHSEPADGEILEAEYTVVDSTETAAGSDSDGRPPQLKN